MSQLVHPGIVTVYELSEDNDSYFIVMEFIAGLNLREHIKNRGGKLSLPEIIDILVQSVEALDYVHSHNIIHRDIKPQNMLLEEKRDGNETKIFVKLVDFGVARLGEYQNDNQSRLDSIVGTYAYMSPEATGLVDWPLDGRTDIYSMGIVAYELIAGKVPFYDMHNEDIMRAHVEQTPKLMSAVRGQDVPEIIEKIIMHCIEKNPADRYQSMFGLLCDLKRLQNDLRIHENITTFDIARKDIGIGKILDRTFIGRDAIMADIIKFIKDSQNQPHVTWGGLRGGIGVGKSRCLTMLRKNLDDKNINYLYLRFSESEQRLPFQSLSLAINDYLSNLQRHNKNEFLDFLNIISTKMSSTINNLSRFIAIIRQHLKNNQQDAQQPSSMLLNNDDFTDDAFSLQESLDKRYIAPNQSINDAFLQLLSLLLGNKNRLLFLMDDLHLADSSTLTLLLYVLDKQKNIFQFSVFFTLREKQFRANLLLENLLKRLSLEPKLHTQWTIFPFDNLEIQEFLSALGMKKPTPDFINVAQTRTGGSATQLNALIKQMLAQDVLIPVKNSSKTSKTEWELELNLERLKNFESDYINVEILISSLDVMDKRELQLMSVVAVSRDSCEFEYFRINSDFSNLELETRLLSLVRKGVLEIVGDEQAPMQRKSFVFTHEKIRSAILATMDMDSRRQIHCLLANQIESLYRTPRREQILSLAKHYDGAADKVKPTAAVQSFLRAARIYISTMETNLARYYIDKALESTARITQQRDRLQKLRECYETEYMIQAAQGNLVEASEVCRNLIEITYDAEKKEALQIFWAQLLLGLGRHKQAYRQSRSIIEHGNFLIEGKLVSILAQFNSALNGLFIQSHFYILIEYLMGFANKSIKDSYLQAIITMMFSHLHGGQKGLDKTYFLGIRFKMFNISSNKWTMIFSIFKSIFLIRSGNLFLAYKTYEESEALLQANGFTTQLRWAISMRSLWLDYPSGKIERLLSIVDGENNNSLPSSGIMHFEALGMRSWIMLISPSCKATLKAASSDGKLRRRSDKPNAANNTHNNQALLDSNIARRILDSGENSQYTALSVFCDALRYALGDKIEPLRRATEQLRRQISVSPIGDTFSDYAYAFQALVLGHQHEALKFYEKATLRLMQTKLEIVSLVVSDALRLAAILLPLMAKTLHARGWPWGVSLYNALSIVNQVFIDAEGHNNPRRSAMTSFFKGFLLCLLGTKKEAFILLEQAIIEARNQKSELIECLSLSLLGAFTGQIRTSRATENFRSALKIAKNYNLYLLERQILSFAQIVNIDITTTLKKDKASTNTQNNTREKISTIGLNEVVARMQLLHQSSSVSELLSETLKIVMSALHSSEGIAYLLEKENNRERFVLTASEGISSDIESYQWIQKLLSKNVENPMRILPMTSEESNKDVTYNFDNDITSANSVYSVTKKLDEEDQTVDVANDTITTETVKKPQVKEVTNNNYLVLLAITAGRLLMGWIAVPKVLSKHYSSRDVEQDLVLLGLHVGHILSRVHNLAGIESSDNQLSNTIQTTHLTVDAPVNKLFEIIDGDIPKDIILENIGKVAAGYQTAWRIYRLKAKRILVVQWRIEAENSQRAHHLGELLGRHLRFFVYSLRQSSEQGQLENLLIKLSSDIITILESATKDGSFKAFNLNILIWDNDERRALEGDFGGEHYSFSGNCEIEREFLQEIKGILDSDRLVYHERARKIPNAGGWLFSPSSRGRTLFPHFAQVDFVDQYLAERAKRGAHLGKLLGLDKHERFPVLAVFVPSPKSEAD